MIDAVVERLRVECPALLEVLPAAAAVPPRAFPSAYVFVESEQAAANRAVNATRQLLTRVVAVEIMVRRAEDAGTGAAAQADLDAVRGQVRSALLGWSAEDGWTPFEFRGGRTMAYEGATLVWRDLWGTTAVLAA